MALRPAAEPAESRRPEDARAVTFLGDDSALVAGVRAGNALALAALYDRCTSATCGGFCCTRSGPRLDLADLVQDVFINVLTSVRSLRDAGALRSWLFQVTVRTALQTLARQLTALVAQAVARRRRAGDATRRDARRERASDAVQATFRILKGMDENDRLVFSLRYVSGLDLSEMAEACEMSLSTLKRRLQRAEERFYAEAQRDEALRPWANEGET